MERVVCAGVCRMCGSRRPFGTRRTIGSRMSRSYFLSGSCLSGGGSCESRQHRCRQDDNYLSRFPRNGSCRLSGSHRLRRSIRLSGIVRVNGSRRLSRRYRQSRSRRLSGSRCSERRQHGSRQDRSRHSLVRSNDSRRFEHGPSECC